MQIYNGRYHISVGFGGQGDPTPPAATFQVNRNSNPTFITFTIGNSVPFDAGHTITSTIFDLDLLMNDQLSLVNNPGPGFTLIPDDAGRTTIIEIHRISNTPTVI